MVIKKEEGLSNLRPRILFLSSHEIIFPSTVKLGFKELLNKEQITNSEPFSVTNLLAYLINSEQIGISEQFCDD